MSDDTRRLDIAQKMYVAVDFAYDDGLDERTIALILRVPVEVARAGVGFNLRDVLDSVVAACNSRDEDSVLVRPADISPNCAPSTRSVH